MAVVVAPLNKLGVVAVFPKDGATPKIEEVPKRLEEPLDCVPKRGVVLLVVVLVAAPNPDPKAENAEASVTDSPVDFDKVGNKPDFPELESAWADTVTAAGEETILSSLAVARLVPPAGEKRPKPGVPRPPNGLDVSDVNDKDSTA